MGRATQKCAASAVLAGRNTSAEELVPACLLCNLNISDAVALPGDRAQFTCENCGIYQVSQTALEDQMLQQLNAEQKAKLSFAVRGRQGQNPPFLTTHLIAEWRDTVKLPEPMERIDRLLLRVAELAPEPGMGPQLVSDKLKAAIGAVTNQGAGWVMRTALTHDLLEGNLSQEIGTNTRIVGATLSLRGWDRVKEIEAGRTSSKRAFMAMQYGDAAVDAIYADCFRPAVAATGFELRRLDEDPQAGLIDDRMRVEIRVARFLVADLTHGNKGAYWESGFAEGLGKPVIYTCRKDVFENPAQRPHFDTNHHLTIIWDAANLEQAANNLKSTIRATFPLESILEDAQ
jgi:hypothetical protein